MSRLNNCLSACLLSQFNRDCINPLLNVGKGGDEGRKTGYPRRDQRASRVCGWGASGDVLSEGGKIFGIVSPPLSKGAGGVL